MKKLRRYNTEQTKGCESCDRQTDRQTDTQINIFKRSICAGEMYPTTCGRIRAVEYFGLGLT